MIQRLSDSFATNPPPEFPALIKLLTLFVADQPYRELVEKELHDVPHYAQRKWLLEIGHFTMLDLNQLLIRAGGLTSTNMVTVSVLLKRLIEWSLASDNDVGLPDGQYTRYQWNREAIGLFAGLHILDNVVLGREYVLNKYSQSVPPIIVRKNGVDQIGTGFLVRDYCKGAQLDGRGYIVTARHNIDPAENIEFVRFGECGAVRYDMEADDWTLHPDRDMAALPVSVRGTAIPFYLLGTGAVLSQTITLGYPTISSTDRSYLLAHNGELNAIVTSYLDQQKYLLISNAVSPGNSGGPVLDDAGLCIGMVVRALEGTYEGGVSKANAAIPANEIQNFIHNL